MTVLGAKPESELTRDSGERALSAFGVELCDSSCAGVRGRERMLKQIQRIERSAKSWRLRSDEKKMDRGGGGFSAMFADHLRE